MESIVSRLPSLRRPNSGDEVQRVRKYSASAKERINSILGRQVKKEGKKDEIPILVIELCEWLSDHCSEHGLFRESGSEKEIVDLKKKYDEGKKVDLNEFSIHSIANLLKRWFRETDESILTDNHYDTFLSAMEIKDLEKQIEALQLTILKLPQTNRAILHLLCKMLSAVVKNHETNKMTYQNVAICWAPTIVRKTNISPLDFIDHQANANTLIERLIEHHSAIFKKKDKENEKQCNCGQHWPL